MGIKLGTSDVTFKLGSVDVTKIYLGQTAVYEAQSAPDYLCFTAVDANAQVIMSKTDDCYDNPIKYSTDGMTWNDYEFDPETRIYLTQGEKVYFKGSGGKLSKDKLGNYYKFTVYDGRATCSGNIMTLIDDTGTSTEITEPYTFAYLFSSRENIISAPQFPATALSEGCYYGTIAGTGITEAPSLPATTLSPYCYRFMCYGCSNIAGAVYLSATSLPNMCYNNMFNGCTGITDIYCGCSQAVGEANGAPWGATNATMHYNYTP